MAAITVDNHQQATHNLSPEFSLQHTYAEASSEAPGTPDTFELTEAPSLDMQLNVQNRKSTKSADTYIIELTVSVRATIASDDSKSEGRVLFLIEVKQGGLFTARGFDSASLQQVLNVHCPTMLYPYASALISDLASRAGFMALHLPAVDFNAMYAQRQANQENKSE